MHAACINGHIDVLELLINYSAYPEHLYAVYRDEEELWEWRLPFDPNAKDVTGQTSLYIACILGNNSLLNVLLKWRVKCAKTFSTIQVATASPSSATASYSTGARYEEITPTRKNISFGIQAIMSKLNISTGAEQKTKVNILCENYIDIFFIILRFFPRRIKNAKNVP